MEILNVIETLGVPVAVSVGLGVCTDVFNQVSDERCAGGYKEPARYNSETY